MTIKSLDYRTEIIKKTISLTLSPHLRLLKYGDNFNIFILGIVY